MLIKASFDESRKTYGSPRIHEDLRDDHGEKVGRNRVIRLMQEEGLRARARKRFKCTTMSDHDQPVAANILDREFTASGPNQRWVGDTTEMLTVTGARFYLAAIIDLYSRYCVGWAVSAVNSWFSTVKAELGETSRPSVAARSSSSTTSRSSTTSAAVTRLSTT